MTNVLCKNPKKQDFSPYSFHFFMSTVKEDRINIDKREWRWLSLPIKSRRFSLFVSSFSKWDLGKEMVNSGGSGGIRGRWLGGWMRWKAVRHGKGMSRELFTTGWVGGGIRKVLLFTYHIFVDARFWGGFLPWYGTKVLTHTHLDCKKD